MTGGAFGPEAGYLAPVLSLVDVGVLCLLARAGFWRPEAGPREAEALANPQAGEGIMFLDLERPTRRDDPGIDVGPAHPRQAGGEAGASG